MRDYTGVQYSTIPPPSSPTFTPRIRDMLGDIDYFLRDLSRGMGRIQRGEIPDGSGTTIAGVSSHHNLTELADFDDHPQYLFLAGRAGGQQILSTVATDVPLGIKGFSGQSGDLFQLLSSADAVLANFTSAGSLAGGVLVSDSLHLVSNSFNTSVASIELTSSTDIIMSVPAASYNALTLSMGLTSATLTGPALTFNLNDSGGNNSTITIDNRGGSASPVPFKIYRATAGSTANLTEWRDDAGALLSRITSSGEYDGPLSSAAVDVARTWTTLQTFKDTTFKLVDDADATKTLALSLGGSTTGADLTLALSSDVDRTLTFALTGVVGSSMTIAWDVSSSRAITLPDETTTLAGLSVAQTFTATQTFNTAAGTPSTALIVNLDSSGSFNTSGLVLADTGGFRTQIQRNGGSSADNVVFLPVDNDTILVGTDETVELFNKTLGATNRLNTGTSGSGIAFQDVTTTSKKLRLVLSGAVGNNSFVLSNTAARAYTFGNLSGNVVIVGNDPPAVAAGALGIVDATALAAATGSTNLTNGAPVGVYVVHYEMTCTTGDATAGTLTFDTACTGDGGGAQTISSAALPLTTATLSATNPVRGTIVRYLSTGELSYSTTVTGAFNNARAALRVRVEYLG